MKTNHRFASLLAALLCATALLAYDVGGFTYTKRVETNLLAEPKPLAEAAAKIAYGHKLKVEEIRGAWLRVSEGANAGWVFTGNLSDTKPAEVKGLLDGAPLAASQTTATAAARPLNEAAVAYASGNNLAAAQEDLEWMVTACAAITTEEVEAYLQQNKKGEYQ